MAFPSADLSFTWPSPALEQRRVSLALPSSTPHAPWSFHDDTNIAGPSDHQWVDYQSAIEPKKPETDALDILPKKNLRKNWSPEETQMLIEGCNRHGIGNWKTILSDPTLKFDNRSPASLRNRFRTYFPDAYKKHYPNAQTDLSSKVRFTSLDGSPRFEKTLNKRRMPFTEEEDHALKAGYEKYGTVWATVVKDPIFQERNRRSTDLRDRFWNAFPELYQAAGYKPRKTKHQITGKIPGHVVTDDQPALSSLGATSPVRRVQRQMGQASQGTLLRGWTESMPQSMAWSESEDSSSLGEGSGVTSNAMMNIPEVPPFVDDPCAPMSADGMKNCNGLGLRLLSLPSDVESSFPRFTNDGDEMGMQLTQPEPFPYPSGEYPSSTFDNHPQQDTNPTTRYSDIDTPSNNSTHWYPAHGGPRIGHSAWGLQDWLSPNPRLGFSPTANTTTANANANESNASTSSSYSSYFSSTSPFAPYNPAPFHATQPFPHSTTTTTSVDVNNAVDNCANSYINYYSPHQHYGVVEGYDPPASSLSSNSGVDNASAPPAPSSIWSGDGTPGSQSLSAFGSSFGGDLSPEVSFGDVRSTFSEDEGGSGSVSGLACAGADADTGDGGPWSANRTTTHHTDYAGDVIFGAETAGAPDHYPPTQILDGYRCLGGDNQKIKHVFLQLLDTVEYCHSLGTDHQDLKPGNNFCSGDGLRTATSGDSSTQNASHMSLERQSNDLEPQGNDSPMHNDIWALGIVLLYLVTGRSPWKSTTADDPSFQTYLRSPTTYLPTILPISSEVNKILVGMLEVDHRRRTPVHEIRQAVQDVTTFYSDGVIFEASMARCPWDSGTDIDADPPEHVTPLFDGSQTFPETDQSSCAQAGTAASGAGACATEIRKIIVDKERRRLVLGLRGDEAQCIVDALNAVLRESSTILTAGERKRTLSTLGKLAKIASVFPRCYELKGIRYDSKPLEGGGFADIHKGEYKNQTICVKIIRIFKRNPRHPLVVSTLLEW
ncbi:hypothetical protein P691DRAFT_728189 [Macrolepiota fuliginosa MF-IS2]|uniref:Protein kinase domain-containing protein n=1 Tax=Macrolepiota fuliginosa MF-IS2 TaxID=1400762 RepID=A0A9P5XDA0_9AGAR|nr:hypothetical protein P691DRAFT_728189 [Macrolepiota fuliginosa MF-IS2]